MISEWNPECAFWKNRHVDTENKETSNPDILIVRKYMFGDKHVLTVHGNNLARSTIPRAVNAKLSKDFQRVSHDDAWHLFRST